MGAFTLLIEQIGKHFCADIVKVTTGEINIRRISRGADEPANIARRCASITGINGWIRRTGLEPLAP